MRDLRQYWDDVNRLEKELPAFVWLTPARGPGGLVEVKAAVAAKLLHARSHRMASEDEKATHFQAQDAQRRQAFHADLRRKGIAIVPLS